MHFVADSIVQKKCISDKTPKSITRALAAYVTIAGGLLAWANEQPEFEELLEKKKRKKLKREAKTKRKPEQTKNLKDSAQSSDAETRKIRIKHLRSEIAQAEEFIMLAWSSPLKVVTNWDRFVPQIGGSAMAGKREKPEEIVSKLRQVEVLQGQGMTIADAVRQIGMTQQTYYRWRKLYGGMGRDQLKRLKELEKENQRLRRAVSDLTLDKLILSEATRGNF